MIGGGSGVVLGMCASSGLSHLDLHADLPVTFVFRFDWRIFLYSFSIALLAGVVVGIVPALRIAKANVNTVLHEGSRGVAGGPHWFRDTLVALQIAGSLVLLVVAGLFVRSLAPCRPWIRVQTRSRDQLRHRCHQIGMTDAKPAIWPRIFVPSSSACRRRKQSKLDDWELTKTP